MFEAAANRAITAQPTPPSWTGLDINYSELDRLGKITDVQTLISEIENLKDERGEPFLDIAISQTSPEDRQALNLSITTHAIGSQTSPSTLNAQQAQAILKPLQAQLKRPPLTLKFLESSAAAFKRVSARGQMIPPQTDPYKTGMKSSRRTILLKDFADRETILHEYIHALYDRERERLGLAKPFPDLEQKMHRAQAQLERMSADDSRAPEAYVSYWQARTEFLLATSGEELEVHGTIVDRRQKFGLSDSSPAVANALQNYESEMTRIRDGLAEASKAIEGMSGSEALQNQIQDGLIKLAASEQWHLDRARSLQKSTAVSMR